MKAPARRLFAAPVWLYLLALPAYLLRGTLTLLRLVRPGRAPFDLLAPDADFDHPLHEHTRRVDLLGIQFARLDEGFHLGNRDSSGHGRERVEVAG